MRGRCGCGEPFVRLRRESPDGHRYTVTGCPVCLNDEGRVEAFDALVEAAMKMETQRTPEDS